MVPVLCWINCENLIFLLYLYFEYISVFEWFWIGFGSVLGPRLFWYISHLIFIYSPYICPISIKVYGIYFGNKWKNYRSQNQSKTDWISIQNPLQNNRQMRCKLFSYGLVSKSNRSTNIKLLNLIPCNSFFWTGLLRVTNIYY